jgi:hypothetical protein
MFPCRICAIVVDGMERKGRTLTGNLSSGYVTKHPPLHQPLERWVTYPVNHLQIETRGVSHCGLAIYIKKHLKAKEELWKLKYFTIQKI